jgi:hypothetical protein
MVICPIAMAVHCTGCPFVKFCPAKTILGDYGKDDGKLAKKVSKEKWQEPENKGGDSGASSKRHT